MSSHLVPRLASSSFVLALLALPLAAQGHVRTVDDGKIDHGAAWHLELNTDGSVQSQLELGDATAGFAGTLLDGDAFGAALVSLGDLDGDGTDDLAVGAPLDDHGGTDRGAVWILFRTPAGGVKARRALRTDDGLVGPLANGDQFGCALAFLRDLDGDGRPELAVGAQRAGGQGAVWILSLDSNGSVAHERLLGEGQGGFGGALDAKDRFGCSLASLGDFDGDGVADLAVGAMDDNDGGQDSGALWLLFLNADGTVKSELKLSRTSGGFGTGSNNFDELGYSVCVVGDLDDDGIEDLALGASMKAGSENGGVWILFENADGTVRAKQRISRTSGGLTNPTQKYFGSAVAPLGDLDGDGVEDLAVGASTTGNGAMFVLFLNANGTVKSQLRIEGSLPGLANNDRFGACLATLGDLDGDGHLDLAVGAAGRDGVNDADFTDLQTAVNAAASGDTLLVRQGTYGDFATTVVSAKALTIQGENPNLVVVSNLRVQNLGAAQTVALAGLSVSSAAHDIAPIELADDAGPVWIEECTASAFGAPGLRANACANVVLNRSRFEGVSDASFLGSLNVAPAGLEASSSSVHAYDCVFVGAHGNGLIAPPRPRTPSAAAPGSLRAASCSSRAARCKAETASTSSRVRGAAPAAPTAAPGSRRCTRRSCSIRR